MRYRNGSRFGDASFLFRRYDDEWNGTTSLTSSHRFDVKNTVQSGHVVRFQCRLHVPIFFGTRKSRNNKAIATHFVDALAVNVAFQTGVYFNNTNVGDVVVRTDFMDQRVLSRWFRHGVAWLFCAESTARSPVIFYED